MWVSLAVMSVPHDPPSWARAARPANVRATSSAAPERYDPIPEADTDPVYTHRSHAAQYGAGRRWGFTVRGLIIHTTETGGFSSTLTADMYRAQTVSATAYAGPLGELALTIPGNNRPWTTGRWNDETESLEVIGHAAMTEPEWRSRPKQLAAIENWIVARCKAHSLPAVWLDAIGWAEGASRQSTTPYRMGSRQGVTDHWTANQAAISLGGNPATYSHHDVGPALRSILRDEIVPAAAARLAQPPTESDDDMGTMTVLRVRWDGYADQIVGFHTSLDTLDMAHVEGDLVVLPRPDAALLAQIETELGHPLTPI